MPRNREFLSQQALCPAAYPLNDLDHLLNGMGCAPVARRPAYRLQRVQRPHHHYHHHYANRPRHVYRQQTAPRSPSFAELLGLMDASGQEAAPEVFSEVLETPDSFQLVFRKGDGSEDFRSYVIRYVAKDRHIDLITESEDDGFQKVYRFKKFAIDITKVDWKVTRNLLVVDIPKVGAIIKNSSIAEKSIEKPKKQKETETKASQEVTEQTQPQQESKSFKEVAEKTQPQQEFESGFESDYEPELQPLIAPEPEFESPIPTPAETTKETKTSTSPKNTKEKEKTKPRIISIPIEYIGSNKTVISKVKSSTEPDLSSEPSSCSSSATSSDVEEDTIKEKLEAGEKLSPKLTRSSSDVSEDQPSSKMPKRAPTVVLEDVEDEAYMDLD